MANENTRPKIEVEERATIAELALRLTGSRPESEARLESCIVNILRRMAHLGLARFDQYLAKVANDQKERGHLVSALTIHHTSWFREAVHLDRIKSHALEFARQTESRHHTYTLISAGCSSGEEAFSIALVLQKIKQDHPSFEYRIEGWDVDPVSVANANRAIYPDSAMMGIPDLYKEFLYVGSGRTKGFFTLDKSIRDRCVFRQRSLLMLNEPAFNPVDAIFCRNVLIYFKPDQVQTIIKALLRRLHTDGMLVLGHSEAIEAKTFQLESLGNSCYRPHGSGKSSVLSPKANHTRGVASGKPSPPALKRVSTTGLAPLNNTLNLCRPTLILVGASTGGTDALERLLADMPMDCPPVVVVQHIAHAFAKSFAERLATVARLRLGDPQESGFIKRGHLYMSWGDYHIGLRRHGSSYLLSTHQDPPLHSVRPSVDFLFESAARGENCESLMACLLTGMGKDGATGMLSLRSRGAMTCTQDEKSSVVFGMPAEANALGASQFSGSPETLRSNILRALAVKELSGKSSAAKSAS